MDFHNSMLSSRFPFPFGPPHRGGPPPPPSCGCCGDVCPIKLDCGCTCDLDSTDDFGNVLDSVDLTKGVMVTVKDPVTQMSILMCVPEGSYADANRVQCVTECSTGSLENVESSDDMRSAMDEAALNDKDSTDLEKESRD